MLGDYGVPYTCFETSDRVGGNWAFGNPNGHSSAYRSLHIDTSQAPAVLQGLPDARGLPRLPAPHPDQGLPRRVRRRVRPAATASSSRTASCTPSTCAGGGWELTDQARRDPRLRPARRRQRPPLGPAHAGVPGRVHRRVASTPTTTSTRPTRWTSRASGSWSSASATAPPTSPSSCPASRCRTRSPSRPGPAPGSCRSTSYGLPADKYFATSPHLPLAWQRKLVQKMQFMTGSNPELYGLPKPNHKFFEAHPTQSVELPLRLGSGDVIPKPQRRAARRADRALRGRHAAPTSTSSSTRPATTSPSRSSTPSFLSAPDNQIRLFKRMFKPGHRRPGADGVRPGGADAVPVRRGQARLLAAYAVGAYALPDGRRDGAGHRRGRAEVHRPRHRPAPAHPAGRLLHLRARPARQGDPGRPRPARPRRPGGAA